MDYGLIGEKLGHSFSKIIHELIGFYSYELKEIPRDELTAYINSKSYKGLNVTIPYKQDVIPLLDEVEQSAKEIGAVNCIVNRDGRLYGYNTDYYGLKKLIEQSGYAIAGKKVLILGTGGTSKTAHRVLSDLGAAVIIKVGRTKRDGNITYDEAYDIHTDADFIVNTTPAGMYPNIGLAPIDLKLFKKITAVYDVVYNPLRTRLMLDAKELDIPSFGGLKMLVYQAIVAAQLFTGNTISEDVADSIYKKVRGANENIVLIGMPAVGKTTLGKRLAKELDMEFVDTDDMIVEKEGTEITEIFASKGEKYFRDIESEVVREASFMKNVVIATGGGAILREENVEVLKSFGRIYLLERKLESLLPTDDRPLANDPDKIKALYETRMPIYRSVADVVIDGEKGVRFEIEDVRRYRDEH